MPEKTIKRRLRTPATPPSDDGPIFSSPGWSRCSSAPFAKERKLRNEKSKPCALRVSCYAAKYAAE
jgi:hypothetical protein